MSLRSALSLLRSRRPHRQGLPIGQVSARGFTLIELSVVILIIAVFAGLSMPAIASQMRDRRVQESAREIALMYRQARLRAVGRGAAVLVRFDGTSFSVREARLGAAATDPNCADLPVSSCLNTPWAGTPAASRLIDGHAEASGGELSDVTLGVADSNNNAVRALEICFTPSGRSFAREAINDGVAFTPLTQAYLASVSRGTKSRQRDVVLMPNGTARLSAQ